MTTQIINYDNLYNMDYSTATRYIRVSKCDPGSTGRLLPSVCQRRLDGELPPVELRVKFGRERADFVWSPKTLLLVSDRTTELFKANGITGWELYDVVLKDKRDDRIMGYRGLSISGRAGKIDSSQSETIYSPSGRGGAWVVPMLRGARFEGDYWDGSDIFATPGKIGISERLYRLIKKHRITGGICTPFSKLIISRGLSEIELPAQGGQT